MLEETGIKKINLLLKKVFYTDDYVIKKQDKIINKRVSYYIAEALETNVKIDGKEILSYKWSTYEKALEKLTFKDTKKVLKESKKFINKNL